MAAAPMLPPVLKATRRGRTIVAWSLWMLAIGLAAGPLLSEHADQWLETGIEGLEKWAPNFLQPYLPKPLARNTPQPLGTSVGRVIPEGPSAVPPARTAREQPEPTPEVAARSVGAKAPGVAATSKANQPERRREQARKPGATRRRSATLAAAESAAPVPVDKPARRPGNEQSDPFVGGETSANEAAAAERLAKTAAEPAAGKSRPAKSGGTLDELMADATSGSQPKDRRTSSKGIDAMLQDVQKSRPVPRPARAESESLPSLTASDIAKVMAGVKSGARACGKRFGQTGVADLRLAVGKDGKVTDVAVRGHLAGSPISDCITQVVQGASFPPNSGLKFNYRIDIQ